MDMDSENVLNCSLKTSDSSSNTSITAKLRRLKIQEDLLIQTIKKSLPDSWFDGDNFIKSDLEYKKYVSSLKKANAEAKQLLEDINCTTKSQDILKTMDIDDIKKDVLGLEHKLKTFKTFLSGELTELKKCEKDLSKQLEDDVIRQSIKPKKNVKMMTKTFSDIVPSPVKNIINSPFKCPEVQRFQDFISSSNRYGGWNEYNHNIFVNVWKKHFGNNEHHADTTDNVIEKDSFINEIFEKVTGIKTNDIIAHMNWYSKYLNLKTSQQLALKEWRAKNKPKRYDSLFKQDSSDLKKSDSKINVNYTTRTKARRYVNKNDLSSNETSYDSARNSTSTQEDNTCKGASLVNAVDYLRDCCKDFSSDDEIESEFRFAKPTKQWKYRCNSAANDSQVLSGHIDDIRKLGVPLWRHSLSKEGNY